MRTVRGLLGLALVVLVAHCGGGDAPSAVGGSGGGEDAGGGSDGAVGPTAGDDAATNNSDGGAGTDAAGNRDASDASDTALDGGGDADAGPPPIVTGSAYAHDQGGRLIGEYDEDGRPLEELIYLEDRVVATVRSGKAFAVQTDQLGAPRTVLADNAPVWSWDPEPFGATPPNEDVDGDGKKFVFDQRFPGQRFDAVTGLHQNFHRNYAPEWARYLEADPIGLAGGMNLYGYVGASPTVRTDSAGLEVDLNLWGAWEQQGVADIESDPLVFTVGAHGGSNSITDNREMVSAVDGTKMKRPSVEDLAAMIRAHPKYRPGMPVKLIACTTGKDRGGFADRLAQELGTAVSAPRDYVYVGAAGYAGRPPTRLPMLPRLAPGETYVLGYFLPGLGWSTYTPRKPKSPTTRPPTGECDACR